MSFSDFGRSAMTAAVTNPPPSGVSKARNIRRSSDPLPPRRSGMAKNAERPTRPDGRRRANSSRDLRGTPNSPAPGSQTSNRRRSEGSVKNTLEIQRGVRPRLNNIQCPVTKKALMDDVLTVQGDDGYIDTSLASTSVSSSTTNHDHSYDDDSTDQYSESDAGLSYGTNQDNSIRGNDRRKWNGVGSYIDGRKRLPKHYNNIPGIANNHDRSTIQTNLRRDSLSKTKGRNKKHSDDKNRLPKKSSSPLSKLSTEIAQFQKMVANLESLSKSSASSPEDMWKSRILLRSAEDANRDLKLALEKEEQDAALEKNCKSPANAAKNVSRKKLQRDFRRASEQYRSLVEEIERRQRVEISCLTANEAATMAMNPEGGDAAAAQKRSTMGAVEMEEDFFERAMRERQAEVEKISDGMKKVQEIYTDLAGLVDDQQDQIDQLEDINEEVKAHTRAGLEEIQHGMWKLCVADQHGKDKAGVNHANDSFDGVPNPYGKKKVVDPSDILNCMMACQGHPLSQDDDIHRQRASTPQHLKERGEDYYRDEVPVSDSDSGWNLQESAQDAYELGHKMVGGIVGQVQEAVSSGEGLPIQLREVGNRISCTPQPHEYSSSELDDNGSLNEMIFEDRHYEKKKSSNENYYHRGGSGEDFHHGHHSGEYRHSTRSHHSPSASHSKQRNHDYNLSRKQGTEKCKDGERDYRGNKQRKKEHNRRKGRKL